MANEYVLSGVADVAASTETLMSLEGATTAIGEVGYICVAASSVLSDNMAKLEVLRTDTTLGSGGTAIGTPGKKNDLSPTAQLDGRFNHTSQPTDVSNSSLLYISLHLRNTFQWYAQQGKGLLTALSATKCIAMKHRGYSGGGPCDYTTTFHFYE